MAILVGPTTRLRRRDVGGINFKNKVKLVLLSLLVIRIAYWYVSKSTIDTTVDALDLKQQGTTKGDDAIQRQQQQQQQLPIKQDEPPPPPKDPRMAIQTFKTVATEPIKPLSPTNLDIVSRTHPVDLQYVDATGSGGNKGGGGAPDHPHAGGKDEDGNDGYVHNQLSLLHDPPPFQIVGPSVEEGDACAINDDGNRRMLTEKVHVDMAAHEEAEDRVNAPGSSYRGRAKIMCIVYTIEAHHDRIPPIRQTWGPKCDGFVVISDKTDPNLGTVHVPHEGSEEYNNIWQKIRSAWSYVYDNYYEYYDWFHIGGDDLYLLVENLRLYLESDEIRLAANGGKVLPFLRPDSEQYPLFLGRRFKEMGNAEKMFNSGGSGYTLNKAALKALVVDGFPTCLPHHKTFAEDVMVAKCLREKFNVYPYDTKDEDGGERYMPFQPGHHLNYKIPKGPTNDWYVKYSIDIKEGLAHCAAKAVAFHYIKPKLMKRMHAILYGLCPS